MSYIGNQPTTVAFLTDQFSGTGSQTAFTLSAAPANTASIIVAVSGVLQDPTTYSVSGLTLTFSAAPPSGTGNISVRFLGIPASGIVNTAYRTQTEFTATAGQTTFSVPSYTVGFIDVYRNGALLGSADFTATNGTTVVLAAGASAGDLVETISFSISSVLNAIPATAGAVNSTYLLDGSVTKAKMAASGAWAPTGTVIQVVSATSTTSTTITGTSYADTGLSASITPTSSSSKILVLVYQPFRFTGASNGGGVLLFRNTTQLTTVNNDGSPYLYYFTTGADLYSVFNASFLDSPATTSSTTYKTQARPYAGAGACVFQNIGPTATNMSTITLLEIAG